MLKYILITFFFLGFAFYELSGGADFDPETLRLSRIESAPLKNDPFKKDTIIVAENITGDKAEIVQTDTVERGSIAPLSANTVAFRPPSQNSEAPQTPLSEEAEKQPEVETEIILPSLIPQAQGDGAATVSFAQPQAAAKDLRLVSGNRVNVRGGPGTSYGVVAKLKRGAQVEVLTDDGNGWVEFRTTDGNVTGWVADFLLSD